MKFNRGIFPAHEEEPTETIFPETVQEEQLQKTKEHFISVAERYADRQNLTLTEAIDKVQFEGVSSIIPDTAVSLAQVDVVNRAYENRMTPEEVRGAMNNYIENKRILANAKEDTDVAETVISDPLSLADVRNLKLAKLKTAIQKITPDKGLVAKWGIDFLGYLGREATYGVLENLSGATGIGAFGVEGKSTKAQEWYKRILDAPIENVDQIANEIAKEMASYGIYGDNVFYLGHLSESIVNQGMNENEVLWSAIDIGTFGIGKAAKVVAKTNKVMTAARIATAADPVDIKIATNGVEAGDGLLQKVLSEGSETTVETARQASPGISRVATVNAENAIAPTIRPVLVSEAVARTNATLEKVLSTYSVLKPTPEVIARSAAKFVEDFQIKNGFNILNFTREVPIVKQTGKISNAPKVQATTGLLEGVTEANYKVAVDLAKTNKNLGKNWSLSTFMKSSGLSKSESLIYVKQLRQDGIIDGSSKILRETPMPVAKTTTETTEMAGPLPPPVQVLDLGGLDTYKISMYIGKKDGSLFKTETTAQKAANQLGGSVVRIVNGFAVKKEKNLPIEYYQTNALKAEEQELRSFWAESIMSPETTTNLTTESYIKSGTSRINAVVRQVTTDLRKAEKKLTRKEREGVLQVINDLMMDPVRREWYTPSEFKDVFYKHTNELASENAYKAYKLRADMYEAAYILRADPELKSALTSGEFIGAFKGIDSRRIKKVSVAAEEDIFDADLGKFVKASSIKNKAIYEIMDEVGLDAGDYKQFYVSGELLSNRALTHSDVLGYKPGANRLLPNATHLVVQDNIVETYSGKIKTLSPRTILAERSQQITEKAANEINSILAEIRKIGRGNDAALRASTTIDNVIKENNSFNPNIEDIDDFIKYMNEAGIGYNDVKVVRADDVFDSRRTYRDIYDQNANPVGRKPDLILNGYGIRGIQMMNPFEAINRDFSRGINIAATAKYFDTAIPAFIKKGEKYISNYAAIKNMPKFQQIKEANIVGDSNMARALKREQNVILSRLSERTQFSDWWERRMVELNNKIFTKTGRDAFGFGKKKYSVMDIYSSDPTTALRSFAFDLKMGWFALDQMMVQGSNAVSIMSISPKYGGMAAVMYPAMRIVMSNRAPAVLKEVAKRVYKFFGTSEEEFIELTEHLRKSGWFDIGDTLSEIGGGADFGMSYYKRAKESGRFFFREGERISRLMAHFVSYKEFREKFPNVNVKTPDGASLMDEFITNRSNALTFNMSSVSNAAWQEGMLGLTTQWLSYNARFLETLFTSRTLTKSERSQLALGQLAFYGASTVGIGTPLMYMFENTESEVSPEFYTALRGGILDYLLTKATGEQTALSGRLGIGEGLVQTIHDAFNEGFIPTLMGPATGISYDFAVDSWKTIMSLVNGNITMTEINLEKLARNIKSVDKFYQTMWAMNTGDILSKKGFTQVNDASTTAIILNALGIPLQEAQVGFTLKDVLDRQRDYTIKMANVTKDLYRRLNEAADNSDGQAIKDITDEINTIRLGIPFSEQDTFDTMTRPDLNSFAEKMIIRARESGFNTTADRLQKVIEE